MGETDGESYASQPSYQGTALLLLVLALAEIAYTILVAVWWDPKEYDNAFSLYVGKNPANQTNMYLPIPSPVLSRDTPLLAIIVAVVLAVLLILWSGALMLLVNAYRCRWITLVTFAFFLMGLTTACWTLYRASTGFGWYKLRVVTDVAASGSQLTRNSVTWEGCPSKLMLSPEYDACASVEPTKCLQTVVDWCNAHLLILSNTVTLTAVILVVRAFVCFLFVAFGFHAFDDGKTAFADLPSEPPAAPLVALHPQPVHQFTAFPDYQVSAPSSRYSGLVPS